MRYQQHNQPGCGGCILIAALLILVTGGAPALFNFFGFLFFSGFASLLLLLAAFWGFSWYVQRKISVYEASRSEDQKRFVYLLVHILVKIAQADGHFTRAELNTMLNFFQHSLRYNQEQMYWVKQLIKEARNAEMELDELLEEFRSTFAYEPRLILLELIYQIIYTRTPPPENEIETARRIATFLRISSYDQRTIEAKYRYGYGGQRYRAGGAGNGGAAASPHQEEKYYAVLGLEKGAEFVAIKKAYRKLCMQYHPDKVAHLGDEFKAVAEEKMKEINSAYAYFEKKFGK